MLRSLNLLIALLVLLVVILIGSIFNFRQKIQANQEEVEKNIILFQNLQVIVQAEDQEISGDDLFLKKSFASYEEVVPFIAFLESLFSDIDPDAEIIVKSRESQIFIDHFADYTVKLDIGSNKEFLYKTLEELDQSRFIINILSFNMDYKPDEEKLNRLDTVELKIRLFLK